LGQLDVGFELAKSQWNFPENRSKRSCKWKGESGKKDEERCKVKEGRRPKREQAERQALKRSEVTAKIESTQVRGGSEGRLTDTEKSSGTYQIAVCKVQMSSS
jgi:hypothetical protein